MKKIKDLIQWLAHRFGYHVQSKNGISGDMSLFLKSLKTRGLTLRTILDVGAHKGDWSVLAARILPEATYYLIEPQEELKPEIDKFLARHKGRVFFGGAGAEDGELTLTMWEDFAGSSFLPQAGQGGGRMQKKVPIYSIDGLIARGEMPVPDICKIDVQGFEIEVLKGAAGIFGKTEVFILEASLFKFSPDQPLLHDLIAYMTQRGYVIYDFAGFTNRPLDMALGQLDICFVKEDSILRKSHGWA
ncbi:FkbM family methyltransferase [Leadbetterella sp. DM7]|uniref:FkbM family methyltransferase n=1 Tax=Leadbetterella sp. DM7 TaxID=3235085 RepID=UPI00349E76DE